LCAAVRGERLNKKIAGSLLLLVFLAFVRADGFHVSDYQLHMEEPGQKAVISWDGQTETMILSSAVKSDNLSNIAWVVPIQSYSKPEVSEGNNSVFENLVNYFEKPEDEQYYPRTFAGGGVQVLETKELGLYDIAILKATSSADLLKWLQDNGYLVPAEAKSVLDKYVAKGNYYFVANKIDLKNKFAQQLEEVDQLVGETKQAYRNSCDEITQIFYDFGINESAYHFDYKNDANWRSRADFCFFGRNLKHGHYRDKSALDILNAHLNDRLDTEFKNQGVEREIKVGLGNGLVIRANSSIVTRLAYSTNVLDYNYGSGFEDDDNYFTISRNNSILITFRTTASTLDRRTHGISLPSNVIADIDHGYKRKVNGTDAAIIKEFFSLKGAAYEQVMAELAKRSKIVGDKIEPTILDMKKAFGTKLKEITEYDAELFGYSDEGELQSKVYGLYNYGHQQGQGGRIPMQKYEELYDALVGLKRGLGTPLQITFHPPAPYFPLEISSLNAGQGNIEVYVLGNSPARDKNNVLKVDTTKQVSETLQTQLEGIGVSPRYATRLTYVGALKDLSSDAEFDVEASPVFMATPRPTDNVIPSTVLTPSPTSQPSTETATPAPSASIQPSGLPSIPSVTPTETPTHRLVEAIWKWLSSLFK